MSNNSMLTVERLKKLLHYEPNTGIFEWLVRPAQHVHAGDAAGSPNKGGYIQIWIFGKRYYSHRLAWFYMTSEWPSQCIDHIDGNTGNNSWSNLREASVANNQHNQKFSSNNTSGVKGVDWHTPGGKWRAQIKVAGKKTHIGYFSDIEDARLAIKSAREKLHGQFANHG